MNISIDPSGNIIVHDCGCPEHGAVSLWEDHELEWRKRHNGEVMQTVERHQKRVRDALAPPPGGASLQRFALARANALRPTPRRRPK